MRKLILKHFLSPGDVVMLTAAIRDLHRCHPGHFVTDVRTTCPQLWENNPYITPIEDNAEDVTTIECHYPLINESNEVPFHFIHGFSQFLGGQLGLSIRPTLFKGDIHLSDQEKSWISQVEEIAGRDIPFWIVVTGGKYDFTAKWWGADRFQAVVDHFRGKILFVQVGDKAHYHPPLSGVLDLRSNTDLRQLIRLVYHSQGVLCPVTLLMHLAAAVDTKGEMKNRPCVVVAGGREPAHWEAYTHHQYIHTNGALPCCANGGCWRSRVYPIGDMDEKDRLENVCVNVVGSLPKCLDMIRPQTVIERIEMYFEGGAIRYLTPAQAHDAKNAIQHLTRATPVNVNELDAMNVRFDEQLSDLNAAIISEKFCDLISSYPDNLEGRGIVIAAGGAQYYTCAWVNIRMLRNLGCTLPVELWYLGERELTDQMKSLIEPFGVKCVDASEVRKRHPSRILNGWELKPYSILYSRFKEVLYLDADNVAVRNPEFLFEASEYKNQGAVFWPDFGRLEQERPIWRICGVDYRDEPEFESGQILIDKARCWRALMLTMWYNEHSDFFYQYIHGDKETFHLAFRKLDKSYAMPAYPIYPLDCTMCQHDFQGERLFQHRNLAKWSLFGDNPKIWGFTHEETCLRFLSELRAVWDGRIRETEFDPAKMTSSLQALCQKISEARFRYERVGYDSRTITFLPTGTVGIGAADCEMFWNLIEHENIPVLQILSSNGLTCELVEGADGIWRGRWKKFEKMPIALTPEALL